MTRITTTHTRRALLLLAAMISLALGMSLATPAVAFIDEEGDDETAQVDEHVDEQHDAADNGFVDDAADDRETAPVGGVDAGFGGAAGVESSLGTLHLVAVTLLGLAILAHTATARRAAHARA